MPRPCWASSISAANYEVGPEFVERFVSANSGNAGYFSPSKKPGHSMFDLNLYTVDRLRKAGVTAGMLGRCTYAEEDLFFSYRKEKSLHGKVGRLMAVVGRLS